MSFPFDGNGFDGNGHRGDRDGEREHPVFGRLRRLLAWHRVMLALVGLTAGRWVVIGFRGLTGSLDQPEVVLSAIEGATVAALVVGLVGFVRLRPWSVPLLLAATAACALPVTRESVVTGTTTLGQQLLAVPDLPPLMAVQAPSLGLSLPLGVDAIAAGLAVWLWTLRPVHRRVGREQPLAAHALRPGRLAWLLTAAVFTVSAIPSWAASRVDVAQPIGEARAEDRVSGHLADVRGFSQVACVRSSPQLEGPLVRPFYFVVFVGEGPDREGRTVVVAGARRVDAGTGAVGSIGVGDATPAPDAPQTAADLCRGMAVDVRVQTDTRPPFPLSLLT